MNKITAEQIEQYSETLALKLAAKLKIGKINLENMVSTVQSFLILAKKTDNLSELKNFVDKA